LCEQAAAVTFDYSTCEAELALLTDPRLTGAQARKIFNDAEAIADSSGLDEPLDTMERIYYLDAVTRVAAGQTRLQRHERPGVPFDGNTLACLADVSIDWNEPLIKGNQMFDRAVAAMRLPTDAARRRECSNIMAEIADIQQPRFDRSRPSSIMAMALSASERTAAATSLMLQQFFPDLDYELSVQDNSRTMLQLTRLAAALAIYRTDFNRYPQKLDDLVPTVVENLPVDLYNAKPFIYNRTVDGYLLYSVGLNGRDDGGQNDGGSDRQYISLGQQLYEFDKSASAAQREKIPAGADDISIRIPRPQVKMSQ
jgi:hypothetical protein